MKTIELKPIKETPNDFELLEERIKIAFKKLVYMPILKSMSLKQNTIQNAKSDLTSALKSGRIIYSRGAFFGEFNASISRELKLLGAVWDKKTSSFKMAYSLLPSKIREETKYGREVFQKKIDDTDKLLAKLLPEEIAGHVQSADVFDTVLWKTDENIAKTLKGITIAPNLSSEDRLKIAKEWQNNMDLWITDFAKKEIVQLRKDIQSNTFAGRRYGDIIKSIQKSYEVTTNKAKFLARQETNLLMTKFKETRYIKAGVRQYKWGCVAGTAAHPVRPDHKRLEGKIFSWDNPPVTDLKTNARNNPGQDYNCRCYAKPIVSFNT